MTDIVRAGLGQGQQTVVTGQFQLTTYFNKCSFVKTVMHVSLCTICDSVCIVTAISGPIKSKLLLSSPSLEKFSDPWFSVLSSRQNNPKKGSEERNRNVFPKFLYKSFTYVYIIKSCLHKN